jgi:hypothetical protein
MNICSQSVVKTTANAYNKQTWVLRESFDQEKFTSYLDPHYQFQIEQIYALLCLCRPFSSEGDSTGNDDDVLKA